MKKLMTMIAAAAMSFGLFAEFAPHEISYTGEEDVNPYVLPQGGLWTFTDGAPAAGEVQIKDQALLLSTGSKVLARQFEAEGEGTEIPEDGNLYADMVLNLNNEILDTVPELDEGTKIALFAMGGEDAEEVGLPAQTNVYVYAAHGDGKALFKLLNNGETFISSARRVAIKAYRTVMPENEDVRTGFLLSTSSASGDIKDNVEKVDEVYTFNDETKKWVAVELSGTAGDYLGGITVDGKFGKWIATTQRSLFVSIDEVAINNGLLTSVDFKGRAALTSIKLTNADTEQEWPEDSVAMDFTQTDAEIKLTQDSLNAGFAISGNKITAPVAGPFSFTVDYDTDNVTVMLGEDKLTPVGDVYTAELNPDVSLTVKGWDTAATVGDEKFESLFGVDGAIAWVNANGGTLKLAKDVPAAAGGTELVFSGDKDIILDLAGKTFNVPENGGLSNTGKLTIMDSLTGGNIVGDVENINVLVISNGVFNGGLVNTYNATDGDTTIYDGTFNGVVENYAVGAQDEDAVKITAVGGKFLQGPDAEPVNTKDAVEEFIDKAVYEVVDDENGYWQVQEKKNYVAQISDDVQFETLAEAFAAVGDDQTITLLTAVDESVLYEGAAKFTIDLNGQTWTWNGGQTGNYAALKVFGGAADITIVDGNEDGLGKMYAAGNGFCIWAKSGTVTINSGKFYNNSNDDYAIYVNGTAAVVINGGEFRNEMDAPYIWKGDLAKLNLNIENNNQVASITVNGGTFSAEPKDDSGVKFVAEGKKAVVNGGIWSIAEITYVTLTIKQVENCEIAVTDAEGAEVKTGAEFDVDDAAKLTVTRKAAEYYVLNGYESSEVITMDDDKEVTAAVAKETNLYYADLIVDGEKSAVPVQLGNGDHIYPWGESVPATHDGVMVNPEFIPDADGTWYVSKLVLKDGDQTWEFEYNGEALTKTSGSDAVTIVTGNVLNYTVTTGHEPCFGEVYLTKYDAPAPTPVIDPTSGETEAKGVKADDATTAEQMVIDAIKAPAGVDATAYKGYFTATAKPGEAAGTFDVEIKLSEDVVKAAAETTDVAAKLSNIAAATGDTEIAIPAADVKPGLYYSLVEGQTLGNREEGARTQATSEGVTLTATHYAGSGFYQIKVSASEK